MSPLIQLTNTQSRSDLADHAQSIAVAPLPSSQSHTQNSLYLTFKVAQLISSFRRRVKTRALSHALQSNASAKRFQAEFCQEFEREAIEEIDKSLRKDKKAFRHNSGPHARARRLPCSTGGTGDTEDHDYSPPIQQTDLSKLLLKQLEIECTTAVPISALAGDDRLLLRHGTKIDLPWMSSKKMIGMLCLVKGLVRSLQSTNPQPISSEYGLTQDGAFRANLEHILVCLEMNLLQLIIIRTWTLIAKYLVEWQTEKRLRREDWFFEFPDALHPLSTTWPWGIRPSLAVIWGVCWMFYEYFLDNDGNIWNLLTGIIVLHADDEVFGGLDSPTPQANIRASRDPDEPASPKPSPTHPPLVANVEEFESPFGVTRITRHPHLHVSSGSGDARQNITDVPAQPLCYVDGFPPVASSSLAPESAGMYSSELCAPLSTYQQGIRSGNRLYMQSKFQGSVSPHTFASSSCKDKENPNKFSTAPTNPSNYYQHNPEMPKDFLSTSQKGTMSPDQQSSRQESVGSVSPSSTTLSHGHPNVKKEDSGLRLNSDSPAFKSPSLPTRRPPRPEPTVENGKYVCTMCHTGPFERKCEWNKHMDKHDRPYRCLRSECVQLQGFTYSGGLLRHEREVHGLHGGPKTHLYCPVATCKRHSQKEFTRKENLAEHMRRVHKGHVADGSNPPSVDPGGEDSDEETEAPTPSSKVSESKVSDIHELLDAPAGASGDKRKRSSMTSETDYDVDVLQENKRLKREVAQLRREQEEKDAKIVTISRELEKLVRVREQGGASRY